MVDRTVIGSSPGSSRIAVVLPVFNGEEYLSAAVNSVLGQTFGDFELVIVDDGSTDRTGEILARIPDARLRVIRHPRNLGLVAALNAGIRNSGGEFIARMDADDICRPRRFERQVAFLE
ncbi:MAG: glycosyltransferase family 2 protein, partial [Planctomycetia bacterium]|nr:glycosyltransferase family 2 protein [Planctomycetia bacterium]